MGDGVEQMGLAQSGVAVDEQRVEVFRRFIRHGPCRRIGQLVLRPHHIRLEGEGVGIQQGAGLIRGHTVIGSQLLVVEDLHLQIGGEDVLQRRLDVLHETGLDGAFLKELLQCSTKAESSMVTTSTSSNHVRMVVSLSCSCNRLSTLCHTSEMEFNESAPFP